jgi:hypothetical protein
MQAALLLLLIVPAAERYGVAEDATKYPQSTPKEALASVLKAIEAKDFRYLMAQLAEPAFVDDRVKRVYAGKFDEQVEDTRTRMDALVIKQFTRLAKDGKMEVGKIAAIVRSEDYPDRMIRLVPREGKWYLSHTFTPPEK